MSVGAAVGGYQWVQLFFRSNDPSNPVGQIDITVPLVTGGLFASPGAVVFGQIPVGKPASRIVDLYDAGALSRRVAGARSLQPDSVSVRVLPLAPGEAETVEGAERMLIARLEVTARTENAVPLDGEVVVDLVDDRRNPCRIPITGEVISGVRCWPRAVTLPRRIGDRTVYRGEILVQSRDESPIEIRLVSAPTWLKVDIREAVGNMSQRTIAVEGKPDPASPRPKTPPTVRLGVRSGDGGEEILVVPVTIAEAPT
jgi:hypothetical protein